MASTTVKALVEARQSMENAGQEWLIPSVHPAREAACSQANGVQVANFSPGQIWPWGLQTYFVHESQRGSKLVHESLGRGCNHEFKAILATQ